MGWINDLIKWFMENWIALGVALWLLEQGLRAVSELTPWEFDNNIVAWFTKILKAIFPKKK